MKTNQKLFVTSLALALMAAIVPTVKADSTCTTQYGGTTTCVPTDLTINKQVKNPVANVYVENLTTTDHTFKAGSEVVYRLIIKNNSGETFNPVKVKDMLPSYLEFVSGPGSYDSASRTVSFELANLVAGESRTVEILAKVVGAEHFPAGKSLFCVTNVAEVRVLNRMDSDSAQVCLQNGEVIRNLPVAGVNNLLVMLPFAGVGLGGLALLKQKKG